MAKSLNEELNLYVIYLRHRVESYNTLSIWGGGCHRMSSQPTWEMGQAPLGSIEI